MSVNIIKGRVRNVVDEVMFERVYKPKGWKIETQIIVDSYKVENTDEQEIKEVNKAKKRTQKKFDDNIIKEG